jgi:hypothetical protein
MTTTAHPISCLRQHMLDDMRMRKLAPKAQTHYLRAVECIWNTNAEGCPHRPCEPAAAPALRQRDPPRLQIPRAAG